MKSLIIIMICLLPTACAGPIAAWKGRAYAEHSLNPGSLITMSGTFRTGRVHKLENGTVFLCLDPFPEVSALMGGMTKLTGKGIGVEDGATPVAVKGHESSTKYQEASLAYTIACNAMINGVLELPDYKAEIKAILADLRTTPGARGSNQGADGSAVAASTQSSVP